MSSDFDQRVELQTQDSKGVHLFLSMNRKSNEVVGCSRFLGDGPGGECTSEQLKYGAAVQEKISTIL